MKIETNVMAHLTSQGLLKVEGNRAKELLQGQFTCDLNEISINKTGLGAHCNPEGRIISLFRLFYYNQCYYLQMPVDMISAAENALKKYAVFYNVQLKDVSDDFIQMGYYGDALKNHVNILPDTIDQMVQTDELLIIKIPGDFPRYTLTGAANSMKKWFEKLAEKHPVISHDIWKYLNIKAALPEIYPETIAKFLPHEINLPKLNGVSFEKGCYTGQEIIARMHYRGKLKTELLLGSTFCDLKPEIGQDIYNEQSVAGSIVDYCDKGDGHYDMLIITRPNNTLYLDPLKKYRIHT